MVSYALVALLSLSNGGAGASPARQQPVNQDAQTQQEFQKRIDAYMELHRRIARAAPLPKQTESTQQIKTSTDALAGGIRAARADAKQGDIFTPETAELLRRLMYPETKGKEGDEAKKAMREDAPAPDKIPFKVNARYPESESLPSVPPKLLAQLPRLPKELEYRIVGRHLILRDVPANLIVDFLPNLVRPTSTQR